jgi:DNA-binding CsgD family transcriptional regulator
VNLKIYNEFYLPQNIHYKLSISLSTKEKALGLIGIFRPREYQDFSKSEIAKARILVPHLTTALENIGDWPEKGRGLTLPEGNEADLPSFGIIVLDYELRPVHWNSEAREFCHTLQRRDGRQGNVSIEDTFVSPEIIQDCLALKSLFEEGEMTGPPRKQRMIEAGGQRIRAVSSLEQLRLRGTPCRRFLIYLTDVPEGFKLRGEILMERYDLTKREADIALCVCQGLTNDEIAERLFISRFTVETHVKNIFSKTDVRHRAGLAGLLQPL